LGLPLPRHYLVLRVLHSYIESDLRRIVKKEEVENKMGKLGVKAICLALLGIGLSLIGGSQPSFHSYAQPSEGQAYDVCPEGPPLCPFSKIQEAIEAAEEGETIRIAPGTYKVNLVIQKSIKIIGAGEDRVLLQPAVYSPEYSPIHIFIYSEAPMQVWLEGLSLHGPVDPQSQDETSRFRGLVILNREGLQAVLRRLTISGYSLGIGVRGGDSTLLDQVTLSRNETALDVESDRSALWIRRAQILDNNVGISGYGFQLSNSQILRNETGIRVMFPMKFMPTRLGTEGDPGWQPTRHWYTQFQVRLWNNVIGGNEQGIKLGVWLPDGYDPPEGVIQDVVYLEGNRIVGNVGYGVWLRDPTCGGWQQAAKQIRILGKWNKVERNGLADLCPEHYPWPEGFTKP
jgi:hypothetical protein